jgi:hypothetical protein
MGQSTRQATDGHGASSASTGNGSLRVGRRWHRVHATGDIRSNRGGLYADYFLDGEMIVERSHAGIYDVARKLQAMGHSGRVVIYDEELNRECLDCMQGDIDRLSKLTVVEDDRGFRIIKWMPMPEELKAQFRKEETADGNSG